MNHETPLRSSRILLTVATIILCTLLAVIGFSDFRPRQTLQHGFEEFYPPADGVSRSQDSPMPVNDVSIVSQNQLSGTTLAVAESSASHDVDVSRPAPDTLCTPAPATINLDTDEPLTGLKQIRQEVASLQAGQRVSDTNSSEIHKERIFFSEIPGANSKSSTSEGSTAVRSRPEPENADESKNHTARRTEKYSASTQEDITSTFETPMPLPELLFRAAESRDAGATHTQPPADSNVNATTTMHSSAENSAKASSGGSLKGLPPAGRSAAPLGPDTLPDAPSVMNAITMHDSSDSEAVRNPVLSSTSGDDLRESDEPGHGDRPEEAFSQMPGRPGTEHVSPEMSFDSMPSLPLDYEVDFPALAFSPEMTDDSDLLQSPRSNREISLGIESAVVPDTSGRIRLADSALDELNSAVPDIPRFADSSPPVENHYPGHEVFSAPTGTFSESCDTASPDLFSGAGSSFISAGFHRIRKRVTRIGRAVKMPDMHRIPSPDFHAPDLHPPDLSFPDIELPAFSGMPFRSPRRDFVPNWELPSLPDFDTPDVVWPDVVWPDVSFPEIYAPKFSGVPSLAKFRLPEVTRHHFDMPDFARPDFSFPDLRLPKFSDMPNYGIEADHCNCDCEPMESKATGRLQDSPAVHRMISTVRFAGQSKTVE